MIHELKISSEYFLDVCSGKKRFEIRKNDRGFKVKDLLVLNECVGGEFTGRYVIVRCIYLLEDIEELGLEKGFCIMSLGKVLGKKGF